MAEDTDTDSKPTHRLEALRAQYGDGDAHQGEFPFAVVDGQPVTELPTDLYIPPDALEVFLEAFEGPLDLLLYLIRRQNLDILDIKVAAITQQYMQYVELMQTMRFELAAEYLVMAAMLAEIKSRMLLPHHEEDEDAEADPRAELIRRLQEYERFKTASEDLDALPRLERDLYPASADPPPIERERPAPVVDLREMVVAFAEVLRRAELYKSHGVQLEPLSVRERMTDMLNSLSGSGEFLSFHSLFDLAEGRPGVVVTFLALMELMREGMVDVVQTEPYSPIHVKTRVAP
jgi:segregation and condensation protein A